MSSSRGTGASRSGRSRAPGQALSAQEERGGGAAPGARRKGADRYRSLVENAIEGVFQTTPDGRILTANPALVEMLGYDSEADLLAVNVAEDLYFDPEERHRISAKISRHGEIRNEEIVLRTKHGNRLIVLENSRGIRDRRGNITHFEGTLTNITAWRDAENIFRTLAENTPVGIFIAQDSRFIFVNPTFVDMTGYSEDELLATGPIQMLQESERHEALQNAIDMMAGKRREAYEQRFMTRSGDVRWTLATISLISYRGRPATLGNFIDITERKQDRDLLETLAASSPVAIYIVQDERFKFVNPQVLQLTGRTEDELLSVHPLDVVLPEDRDLVWASAEALLKGEERRPYEHRVVSTTGDVRWVMDTFTPIIFEGRSAVLGNSVDITERKLAEAQLARQAFYDSLTDLPNRALFMQRLEHALVASRRHRKPVAVMFLDLDDFKTVNDTMGHSAGDTLLAKLGERLTSCVRPTDTVARIGGDEFTVLVDAPEHTADAVTVAQRIVRELQRPFDIDGQKLRVAASIGLAFSEPDRHSAADLLREADVALYHAKSAGKARYVVFGEERRAA